MEMIDHGLCVCVLVSFHVLHPTGYAATGSTVKPRKRLQQRRKKLEDIFIRGTKGLSLPPPEIFHSIISSGYVITSLHDLEAIVTADSRPVTMHVVVKCPFIGQRIIANQRLCRCVFAQPSASHDSRNSNFRIVNTFSTASTPLYHNISSSNLSSNFPLNHLHNVCSSILRYRQVLQRRKSPCATGFS